jgi:hypothetical protein
MHRLQELVRLHRLGVTERRAARELRMGRNTAREYRCVFRKHLNTVSGALEQQPGAALPEHLNIVSGRLERGFRST